MGGADANAQIRGVIDQPGAYVHNFHNGNRQANTFGYAASEQFICQHPDMLWIVLELNDVVVAILGKHQMALGAPAHRAQMLFNLDHRRGMIPRNRPLFSACEFRLVASDEIFHAANVYVGKVDHRPALLDEPHSFL